MKKYIYLLVIFLLIILALTNNKEDEFRIRVIANSNSSVDQSIKMEVVNALIKEVKSYDNEDIVSEVSKNLGKLDKIVYNVLSHEDYEISIRNTYFPPKEYNGEVIKGGNYKALVVVIKNGEGKNWWTLLSPNFDKGFIDDGGEVSFRFYIFEKLKR